MSRERNGSIGAQQEADIRPVVAIQRRDRSPWLFAGLAAVAAIMLFAALDARRRALTAPPQPETSLAIRGETLPDLVLPPAAESQPAPAPGAWLTPESMQGRTQSPTMPVPAPIGRAPARASQPAVPESAPLAYYPPAPLIVSQPVEPAIPGVTAAADIPAQSSARGASAGRVTAGRLANPSDTVPQGTLIGAVLETGLDSTGAGQARALVTRDVFGFDGTRLLIARGSRLYGTYEAGIDQGQKRVQVRWTRLMRPDGVTIALDSPAADPLGQAGVKGKVDSHFGARLGDALLSSTFGLGNALISRRVSPVVVVPNGSIQPTSPQTQSSQIRPTLHVKPGARVSVFVEHDLDFSTVDGEP